LSLVTIGVVTFAAVTFGVVATSLLAVICALIGRPISSTDASSEIIPFALETVPALGLVLEKHVFSRGYSYR
jgi:hypothetical protein